MHQKVIGVRKAGEAICILMVVVSSTFPLFALSIIKDDYLINAEDGRGTGNSAGQESFELRCKGTTEALSEVSCGIQQCPCT